MHNKSLAQILSILSPSIVLRALAMDIFIPCITSVATEFAQSIAVTQWVLSIYFIGAGLGQIAMGPLADHLGRRKVILSSITLFAVSSVCCALTTNVSELIIARLFQGFGACGTTVVTLAVVRDLFEDHATPRVYSYVNSIIALAPLLAPLLGGFLLVWTGSWRSCFYFVTVFSLIAFVINYLYLKETNPRFISTTQIVNKNFVHNYKEVLSSASFLTFTYCAIAALSALFLFFSMSSVLLIGTLKVEPDIYGYYFGFNSLIYLIGNLFSPKLQTKYTLNHVILIGSRCIIVGAAIMLGWQIWFGLSTAGLVLPNLIIAFGIGLMFGPCMAGAISPFKHIAGTASAAYGALLYCLSALIVAAVMHGDISSTLPLAITTLILTSFNFLALHFVKLRNV